MIPARPQKTATDYLVTSLSPALIMLLVGSLCFFLVEVFYRGAAEDSARWVLFWFVVASVLVARIGIEQGTTQAAAYGLALALVTWFYLVRIQPAPLLGAILLGVVWWSAHKLTWDCTLIDDDDDASGSGLMDSALQARPDPKTSEKPAAKGKNRARKDQRKVTGLHSPGVWVIYFSAAALPLFGIGQTLLPAGDMNARRAGFLLLFLYLSAALGLFLTTSFLGLRRYLRQRYLRMPGNIAFGWVRFGTGLAAAILVVALLLPRPGVSQAWGTLRYHIDYQLHRASNWALGFNPPGTGPGRPGDQGQQPNGQEGQSGGNAANGKPAPGGGQAKTGAPGDQAGKQGAPSGEKPGTPQPAPSGEESAVHVFNWLKALLWVAVALAAGWWIWRRWELLLQMAGLAWAALVKFFLDLFSLGQGLTRKTGPKGESLPRRRSFATYENPFVTAKDRVWTPEQLILYSYEALQSWAATRGAEFSPEQTAREFCGEVGKQIPDVAAEVNQLAFLYGHAAYGKSVPANYDVETLKRMWRYISDTEALAAR